MDNSKCKYDIIHIREYFPSPDNPSSSTWIFNQVKWIKEFDFNPIVISPSPKVPFWVTHFKKEKHAWKIRASDKVENYLGVDVIRPSYLKLPNKYFFYYNINQLEKCILRAGRKINAKIIHAHFGHTGYATLKLKKEKKVPMITSFYGFDLGSYKNKLLKHYEILAKEGDLFLALSEDMKNDLVSFGFPPNKIIVHHLGINIEDFAPSNKKKENKKKFIFTIAARYTKRKGIHYAIRAYKKFKKMEATNNCELRIIGDGPIKDKLINLAKGHEDIVFINNFIANNPRELLKKEMQNCDVFILTSITLPNADKEGTPVVLMEAQACGKPCISTFHAGIPEIVIDRKTGILTRERDIDGITNAMKVFYNDKNKRKQYGDHARDHILSHFNNAVQMPILCNIYKKLY